MKSWLQLIRVSGLFSLASNSLAAIAVAVYAFSLAYDLLVAELLRHWPHALAVMLASTCCYAAGMIWNDIADYSRDQRIAPTRPLPSGRIAVTHAVLAAVLVTTAALGFASVIGMRGVLGYGVLISLIMAYNFSLKQVPYLGSLAMAAIRACHAVLALLMLGNDYFDRTVLGLFAWVGSSYDTDAAIGTLAPWYPLVLATYIFGLTVISELADRRSRRCEVMLAGFCWLLTWLTAFGLAWQSHWLRDLMQQQQMVLVVCAGLVIIVAWLGLVWHNLTAWWRLARVGERVLVGPVVRRGLVGILLLDAYIALAFHPGLAMMILILLIPFLLSLRLVRMD